MLRRLSRAHPSQKKTRLPFSTEQVQVSGSTSRVIPQMAHLVMPRSVPTRSF
jgi:hypothetical protein